MRLGMAARGTDDRLTLSLAHVHAPSPSTEDVQVILLIDEGEEVQETRCSIEAVAPRKGRNRAMMREDVLPPPTEEEDNQENLHHGELVGLESDHNQADARPLLTTNESREAVPGLPSRGNLNLSAHWDPGNLVSLDPV